MFDLEEVFKELNISIGEAASIISMDIQELNNIVHDAEDDVKLKIYHQIINIMKDELLFNGLVDFISPYMEEPHVFIKDILELEDVKPRRMINMIRRWVTLANSESKDGIRVLFIIICIEALYNLRYPDNKMAKIKILINFFEQYIIGENREKIIAKVNRSYADILFIDNPRESAEVSLEIFARMIYSIRNQVAHEGNYWDFSFQPEFIDYSLMQFVKLAESYEEFKYLKKVNQEPPERIYEVSLGYDEFRDICINGMINFVTDFCNSK